MSSLDLGLLRHVQLTAFDVNTVKILVKTGGEAPWYPSSVKPETKALIDVMIAKGIVELKEFTPGRYVLRLTEGIGRAAAEQIQKALQNAERSRPIAG